MAQQFLFGSTASAAATGPNLKIKPRQHTHTHARAHMDVHIDIYAQCKHFNCTALENVTQLNSSYQKQPKVQNQKILIPLSCNTVINRYIPFMEKRGAFKPTSWTSHEDKELEMLHY